jgi:hypothetical protein
LITQKPLPQARLARSPQFFEKLKDLSSRRTDWRANVAAQCERLTE